MFVVDMPGTYTFYLDVWDEADLKRWRSATYQVTAIPFDNEHKDEDTESDETQMTLARQQRSNRMAEPARTT